MTEKLSNQFDGGPQSEDFDRKSQTNELNYEDGLESR